MVIPFSSLCTRLIHICPIYRAIYRSFEIILEWEESIGLEFKSNLVCKSIASKYIPSNLNYDKKSLIAESSSGSNG